MRYLKDFLFSNTSNRQTVVKNTFWLFASEGIARVLKMVLVIYAARVLGAEGWGTFSYALSLGSLLMIGSDIGLSGLITREILQKKEGFRSFISTALLVKSIILILSTAAVVLVGPMISHLPEARVLLPLIAITLFFDAVRDLTLVINTAFEKMERDMLAKTVMSVLTVGIGIALLYIAVLPRSVAIAYAVGSVVGCILALWSAGSDMRNLFGKIDRKLIGTVLQTTLPFAAISLITNVMANTDIYLLGVWKDATEIGLYTSVQRIQQFILIIPVIIATAVFPLLSRLAVKDTPQFAVVLGKTTALMFMIGLPISVGGIILSEKIVVLLFGVGFTSAVPILQLLLLMLLASFPLVLFSNSIFAYNGQNKLALMYGAGMLANALFNIILIPRFGAVGSAIATLISTLCITGLVWKRLYDLSRLEVLSRLGRSIIATILMGIALIGMQYAAFPFVAELLIAIVLYGGILWISKEPILREIPSLRATPLS